MDKKKGELQYLVVDVLLGTRYRMLRYRKSSGRNRKSRNYHVKEESTGILNSV